ncbi:hypothetical protein B0H14DRAFT_2639487 [Mycena olivaceomarginata]|nr:hypothetical protein B0H14DRAFT_2639487 [Mycena olivaceomarginata]
MTMSALPSRRIAPDQAIIPLWVERGYMDCFDGQIEFEPRHVFNLTLPEDNNDHIVCCIRFNTDAQSLAALSGPDGEEFVKAVKEVLKIRRRRGLACGIGVHQYIAVDVHTTVAEVTELLRETTMTRPRRTAVALARQRPKSKYAPCVSGAKARASSTNPAKGSGTGLEILLCTVQLPEDLVPKITDAG